MKYTEIQNEIVDYVEQYKSQIDCATWAGGDAAYSCRLFLEWAEEHAGMIDHEAAKEYYCENDYLDHLDASLRQLRGLFLENEFPESFIL